MNSQELIDENLDVFVVTSLEQLALLTDQFKLRLLRAFAAAPTTVKQVATTLEEKPTRLYRHVDALLAAGLLRVVREQPKRGTVERTLQAVASRFEADPSLFNTETDTGGDDSIRDQFRHAADALIKSLSAPKDSDHGLAPIYLRVLLQASPARMQELRTMLADWIEAASAEPSDERDLQSASAMLVFHQNPED